VRDESVAGSRRVELDLPDGQSVRVAEHHLGWAARDDPGTGETIWPSLGAAVEALTGRRRAHEDWIAVLEEFATALRAAAGAPLPAEDEARLAGLPGRHPGVYVDGPRAHDSGGWYAFVGGLPDGAWVMEFGDTPLAAARAALARVEPLLPEA
jgi:hypothetical protein